MWTFLKGWRRLLETSRNPSPMCELEVLQQEEKIKSVYLGEKLWKWTKKSMKIICRNVILPVAHDFTATQNLRHIWKEENMIRKKYAFASGIWTLESWRLRTGFFYISL